MKNIYNICRAVVLFIFLVNIVYVQNNTAFPKELVVYIPVSNVIDGINDAIINIIMENPSNETMNVEINVIPPPNIYIYGLTQSATGYIGTFIIDAGQSKTVEIRIKSDKKGTYSLDFTGQFRFGTNPSRFEIKTYTQVIEVKTPSINVKGIPEPTTKPVPDISIGFIFLVVSIIYLYIKKKRRR